MDAECKAIEKKMQSEVDQFKSIQKGKQIRPNDELNEMCVGVSSVACHPKIQFNSHRNRHNS